jgi:hypothetical protein
MGILRDPNHSTRGVNGRVSPRGPESLPASNGSGRPPLVLGIPMPGHLRVRMCTPQRTLVWTQVHTRKEYAAIIWIYDSDTHTVAASFGSPRGAPPGKERTYSTCPGCQTSCKHSGTSGCTSGECDTRMSGPGPWPYHLLPATLCCTSGGRQVIRSHIKFLVCQRLHPCSSTVLASGCGVSGKGVTTQLHSSGLRVWSIWCRDVIFVNKTC